MTEARRRPHHRPAAHVAPGMRRGSRPLDSPASRWRPTSGSRTRLLVFAAAFALWATPSAASAQFAFADMLLDRVTDASIFTVSHGPFGSGGRAPDGLVARQGYGFELLFALGRSSSGGAEAADTTYRITEREVTYSLGDSVVVVRSTPEVEADTLPGRYVYELGVSYVEVPFSVGSGAEEVRGAVRSLPIVTVYATRAFGWSYVYGGVRTGLNTLTGVRGFWDSNPDATGEVTTTVVVGGGDALHAGVLAGVGAGTGRVSIYADVELARRSVNAVRWEGDIPAGFPRRVRFSPLTLSVGAQIGSGKRVFSSD